MRILIVEDEPIALSVLKRVAAQGLGCTVIGHHDALDAIADCTETTADLVLVDYQMPGLDGIEFIRRLRAQAPYAHVPVVMITAEKSNALKMEAIEAGATDFLNKPVDPEELKSRARNLLKLRQAQLELADRARLLASEVERATRRLVESEEEIIWRLARAIEYRDGGTGEHISRVASISRILAEELRLEPDHCRNIYLAAPLHDVGKVGIADSILNKPGKLTEEEFAEMRRHVEFGAEILADGHSDLVRVAASIAASHHEKWNGTGYPLGLAGEAIPVEGRIVAIADVFDALCSRRSYKDAWSPEDARAEISGLAGTHFDPACVAAFDRSWPRLCAALSLDPPPQGWQRHEPPQPQVSP